MRGKRRNWPALIAIVWLVPSPDANALGMTLNLDQPASEETKKEFVTKFGTDPSAEIFFSELSPSFYIIKSEKTCIGSYCKTYMFTGGGISGNYIEMMTTGNIFLSDRLLSGGAVGVITVLDGRDDLDICYAAVGENKLIISPCYNGYYD